MSTRNTLRCPIQTPWGRAITREFVAPNVWVVTTESHGGYYVEPSVRERIPLVFRRATFTRDQAWYEEDVDWAIVARYFPEAFPPEAHELAETILRQCHPRVLAATSRPIPRGWDVID
jgi:hypothetical protein